MVGIIYIFLLLILLRDKDNKNVQPFKWYINCILLSFTFTLIITAITIYTLGTENENLLNYFVGFGIFPFIGIITTPNILIYVKKDIKWKKILYNNGNIHKINNSNDYYRVHTPVSFEKKILSTVYKEQLKNILIVIGFMIFVIVVCIYRILIEHNYTGGIIRNLIEYRAERFFGLMFFLTILFLAFGVPIIVFYISNAIKKIKLVKNHEYIAYHVIASGVRNGCISIYNKNEYYKYKYCTCVGIKEKDVNFTPATLIFIPDDVLLFPDNDEYKVDKYIK